MCGGNKINVNLRIRKLKLATFFIDLITVKNIDSFEWDMEKFTARKFATSYQILSRNNIQAS